jgi:hypothetical protein
MAHSAALVVLPSGRHGDEGSNASHAAALLAQSLVDLDLAERVERALRGTGYPALRAARVSVCGRLVILEGRGRGLVARLLPRMLRATLRRRVRGEDDLGRVGKTGLDGVGAGHRLRLAPTAAARGAASSPSRRPGR